MLQTSVHKECEKRLVLDNRPAWACFFVEDATGRWMGVRLKWLDGPWACTPDEHFTEDGGHTYKRVSSSLSWSGWNMQKEIGLVETDAEKLASLNRLMAAYKELIDEELVR